MRRDSQKLSETLRTHLVHRIGNGPVNSNHRNRYCEVKFKRLPARFLYVGVYMVYPEYYCLISNIIRWVALINLNNTCLWSLKSCSHVLLVSLVNWNKILSRNFHSKGRIYAVVLYFQLARLDRNASMEESMVNGAQGVLIW